MRNFVCLVFLAFAPAANAMQIRSSAQPTVPSLVGLERDSAQKILSRHKLSLVARDSATSPQARGVIIRQDPQPGAPVPGQGIVQVTLSRGRDNGGSPIDAVGVAAAIGAIAGAAIASRGRQFETVPDVVGLPRDSVARVLERRKLISTFRDSAVEGLESGIVVMQTPRAGSLVSRERSVALVFSVRPGPVEPAQPAEPDPEPAPQPEQPDPVVPDPVAPTVESVATPQDSVAPAATAGLPAVTPPLPDVPLTVPASESSELPRWILLLVPGLIVLAAAVAGVRYVRRERPRRPTSVVGPRIRPALRRDPGTHAVGVSGDLVRRTEIRIVPRGVSTRVSLVPSNAAASLAESDDG